MSANRVRDGLRSLTCARGSSRDQQGPDRRSQRGEAPSASQQSLADTVLVSGRERDGTPRRISELQLQEQLQAQLHANQAQLQAQMRANEALQKRTDQLTEELRSPGVPREARLQRSHSHCTHNAQGTLRWLTMTPSPHVRLQVEAARRAEPSRSSPTACRKRNTRRHTPTPTRTTHPSRTRLATTCTSV